MKKNKIIKPKIFKTQKFSNINGTLIPIYVNKVGFSAKVSNMALNKEFLYGFLAVLVAVSASLFVNFVMSLYSNKEE